MRFPIKLTAVNFPVWRCQIHATLVGFNLFGYVDGTTKQPAKFADPAQTSVNPAHLAWYRQDQVIVSALLGSCTDTIQPLISAATTAHDAWQRLAASYASASRGRIISLKAKLTRNRRGSQSITTYLNDMRAITDDLALAQCLVSDEDLTFYVLTQLGEDYNSITSAIRVREKPLSFGELADVLTDHERQLKNADALRQSFLTTANVTQRTSSPLQRNHQSNTNRRARNNNNHYGSNRQQGEHNRSGIVCKFCYLTGHETRVCHKLARFLKEHNVPPLQTSVSSTANSMTWASLPWMFDSGASHHVTPSLAPLQTFAEYSGSDEIRLGDGNSLQISHIGQSVIPTPSNVLTLDNVLRVRQLHTNLVSIS
ncbi:PREDICTED: uncharacterized protein LOC109183646 [Ipomoea nil]|uniref:uncharacterized protein LOC109183646 n=1 Tax=Ipomoea nil TaxID=35883 RepID=UPI0009010187|nr:PREDICTED: uncharacterized protein LOC109183646 [Ipomoea nil]